MPEQVNIGVIGTSWYAENAHLSRLEQYPRANLVAVCGRDRDRAEEMAKQHRIPRVFTDYREMIEKGDLQAIIIAAPDDLHYPMTMDALDAGLHVLCEKPMALNAKQAGEMYETAEAVGIKHMVNFGFRWSPSHCYVKELTEQGYVGRCYDGDFQWLAGFGRSSAYRWRYDRQRGNGVLGDVGSHMIDLARWYVGDITRVSASLSTFVERQAPDGKHLDSANDSAVVTVQFENGAQGTIRVSVVSHIADRLIEQHTTLHGESGTLEADFSFQGSDFARSIVKTPFEIRGAGRDAARFETLAVPDPNTERNGDWLFIDAILDDRPASPSFYDGLKAQEVIDAALESHRTGCEVRIQPRGITP